MKKKILSALLAVACAFTMVGCGAAASSSTTANSTGSAKLGVAYQYGLSYAPVIIAKEKGLIEAAYKEATGNDLVVEWTQMSSGADINTGIASGTIQAGFVGVGPAVTGVAKNVGYKIFTNLSGQEHGFMTNDPDINSFDDVIGSDKQVALVNIGSFQHIVLAKALADSGRDPHALDANLVKMSHPDGMTSLQSGSIACQVTTNPYIYKERDDANLHEIEDLPGAWPVDNSFIVGIAATSLHDNDKAVYDALCKGISDAVDFINNNLEEACAITSEFNSNTLEDEIKYSKLGTYSTTTNGLGELAKFMYDNGFVEVDPGDYSNLTFDNVKGN